MLKGALHIHSNISSDSTLSQSCIKELFKKRGYSFVLLTEHTEDLDSERYEIIKQEYNSLSDNIFLMISGLEIKWKDKIHFLAYVAKNYMPNEYKLSLGDTIKKIKKETDCDFLAWGHFNHPFKINKQLMSFASMVDGIEISNVGYHGQFFCDWRGLLLLNKLKKAGKATIGIGGLDMHEKTKLGKSYCLIKGLKSPTRNGIFDAFKSNKVIFKNRFFALGQAKYKISIIAFSLLASVPLDYYKRVRMKVSRFDDICFDGYIRKYFQVIKRFKGDCYGIYKRIKNNMSGI